MSKKGSVKLSCKHNIEIDTDTYDNLNHKSFITLRIAFNPIHLNNPPEVITFDSSKKEITLCLDCYERLAKVLPDIEWSY